MKQSKQKSAYLSVPWTPLDCLWIILAIILIPVAVYLCASLLWHLSVLPTGIHTLLFGTKPITEVVAYLFSIIVEVSVLRYFLQKYKVNWRTLGLRNFPKWKALGLVIGFYFLFVLLITALFVIVQIVTPQVNVNQAQHTGFEGARHTWEIIAGFLIIVVCAPVLEESIFRGFLFPAFAKRWGNIRGALVTSVIFGLLHFQTNISIYTFVLGLFLCYLYYKLNSIIPGMMLHMLNNFVAFLIIFQFIK